MKDNIKKLIERMQKYTRDFWVIDKPGKHTFYKDLLHTEVDFEIELDEGDIIASYKYDDGEVGVFWGGSIRFNLHGEDCVLLPNGWTAMHHSGDDLLVCYRHGYADAVCSVSYGPKYIHN